MVPATRETLSIIPPNIARPLQKAKTQYDPDIILQEAEKSIESFKGGALDSHTPLFKALTIHEFDNGMLMTSTVSEQYKTFVIEFCRQLQHEYHCQTVSEKATCEAITISYVRILETQKQLSAVMGKKEKYKIDLSYLEILSKELDRANRHYASALQSLRAIKQPPINFNFNANASGFGNNQMQVVVTRDSKENNKPI